MRLILTSIIKILQSKTRSGRKGLVLWTFLFLTLHTAQLLSAPKHELFHFAKQNSSALTLDAPQTDCAECLIQHTPVLLTGIPTPEQLLFPAIWTRLVLIEQRRAVENRRPLLQPRAPPFSTSLNS